MPINKEIPIPKGVPASNRQEMDLELVGSMGAIGELLIEHQDIHLETHNLAVAVEQNVISLTDALTRVVPKLEQRLEHIKDDGGIGEREYEKLSDDLYTVKEQIVQRITATILELMLNPEQITGDNEEAKNKLANLLEMIKQICEGAITTQNK